LSDVATANANSEGSEWHPKAKLVSGILKENGKTKLSGGGCKWNHKTKLIADILKESDNTKLIGKGCKHYHKTKLNAGTHKEDFLNNVKGRTRDSGNDGDQDPCREQEARFYYCSEKDGDGCAICVNDALQYARDVEMTCDYMSELGFCQMILNCYEEECNNDCENELIDALACIVEQNGCDDSDFYDKCTVPEL
jgi:hypothetical protein